MVRVRVSMLIGSTSASCSGAVMQPARVDALVALSSQAGPIGGRLPGQARTMALVNLDWMLLSRALVGGSVTGWQVPPPGQSASVRHGAWGVEPPLHCGRQIVAAGRVPLERLSSQAEMAFILACE